MIRSTFALPTLIGGFSLIGLAAALTGDGWRDALSWTALAVPLVATGWAMRAKRY